MDYLAFYNDIFGVCEGIPQPVAMSAIAEAVRIFCEESTAYRKNLALTDLSYSSGVYTISDPTGAQVNSVISPIVFSGTYTVYTFSDGSQSTSPTPPSRAVLSYSDVIQIDTKNIYGASPEWLDINQLGWRTAISKIDPDYFCMQSSDTFVLTPDSGVDRSANLTLTAVLLPTISTTTLDDSFGNRWFYAIAAGAKYLSMAMPDNQWTNERGAVYFKQKFDLGIDEAKTYIKTGFRNPQADGIKHVRSYFR